MINVEKYIIEEENSCKIEFGKYATNVYKKHVNKYGEISASKIRKNVMDMYISALKQIEDVSKNNNLLLIGKVQSGKTSNLEMFTALAFDNGYNCVIIYGGYDNILLDQTCKRFRKTFDIDDQQISPGVPELFSTSDGEEVSALDGNVIETILQSNKPLIFISMKRPKALGMINNAISNFNKNLIKAFIIDDEGDQASLNTEFRKNKQSSTYQQIINMKSNLLNPLYLSVTATPQANVLLGEYSELKPDGLRLIEPGNCYTGAEFFHLDDVHIKEINEHDLEMFEKEEIPESLYNAIKYFIISSAIMKKRGINSKGIYYSDMIIHTSREKGNHQKVYNSVYNYIEIFKDNIKNNDPDIEIQINSLKEIFNENYFSKDILNEYEFSKLKNDIKDILNNTYIILQDGDGKITQQHLKHKYHKIYIGGDLLQRGLTFEYLVTTYFTRWPKKNGNMDTIMQRARWFGYRISYLDLCKIFTTKKIKGEYSTITESENDLWEQCYLIEKNELSIEDIIIEANSTSLLPTRKNVVSYKKIQFKRKWNSQKIGVFDRNIIKNNNFLIDELLNKLDFSPSSAGRNDEKTSNFYAYAPDVLIINLIRNVELIFNNLPFDKTTLIKMIKGKKIIIEKLFDLNGSYEVRERSFDPENNKIFALQQGPDTANVNLQKYKGDSYVIVNEEIITFQIFRIRPKINDLPCPEYDQFMFSIHFPEKKRGFVK